MVLSIEDVERLLAAAPRLKYRAALGTAMVPAFACRKWRR
jgi:hypothetical protein